MVTEAPEICQAPGASDSPKGNTAAGHIDDQMVTVGTDPHDSDRPENEAAAVQPDAAQDVSKEVPAPSENQTDVPDVPIKVQVKGEEGQVKSVKMLGSLAKIQMLMKLKRLAKVQWLQNPQRKITLQSIVRM